MSVADILAAARAGKASGAQPDVAAKKEASKSEPKPESKPKPAAAPQAKSDKAAPKPAIKAAPAIDTASILAAARKSEKPGPISKAEAAAKGKSDAAVGKKKLEVPPMPQRPAFAKPVAQSAAAPAETRRGFFAALGAVVAGSKLALGFSSLAVTHLLWALGLARFMFPNILTEPPTRFKVGFPDTLAPGQVDEKYKAQFGVWIVKYEYEGQPEIYALKTVCTHLGCTPNWLEAEQKFKCPCHGSGFYKDGINFEGPAPRPLERYAIRVADDGQLEVDKSRTFHEETGNWRDPASFVPA
jgi:cytochrome b6-f complex iron-sulfur subunit